MTSDGLHWSTASAQAMGLRLAQQLQQVLGISGPAMIISQADVYDATYNPDGALNFSWLMNATSGSPTSPLTGNIAGNYGAHPSVIELPMKTTRFSSFNGAESLAFESRYFWRFAQSL